MKLTTVQTLALKLIPGVGNKSILKVGFYLQDLETTKLNLEELVPILKDLKIKMTSPNGDGKKEIDLSTLKISVAKAENIINEHAAQGIGVVSYFDDEFPSSLRTTINENGKEDPPVIIYYKGHLEIAERPCVAIIGTRNITPEGESAGKFFASMCAQKGITVVSGLALGCDTSAHLGCIKSLGCVGGTYTIAVLANGLDTIYPPENTKLAEEILIRDGLLISEYPIGTPVSAYNLVARDRLQAGLSRATIVIETGITGGTMHAANATLAAGKPLYSVYYTDADVRELEQVKGNAYLVKKGAKYIDKLNSEDVLRNVINGHINKQTLF